MLIFCLNFILQHIGDRFYLNGSVKFSADLTAMLKKWNNTFPMLLGEYDSTFVIHLVDAVFGRQILSISSVYGKKSNSSGKIHQRLDPVQFKFAQGLLIVGGSIFDKY